MRALETPAMVAELFEGLETPARVVLAVILTSIVLLAVQLARYLVEIALILAAKFRRLAIKEETKPRRGDSGTPTSKLSKRLSGKRAEHTRSSEAVHPSGEEVFEGEGVAETPAHGESTHKPLSSATPSAKASKRGTSKARTPVAKTPAPKGGSGGTALSPTSSAARTLPAGGLPATPGSSLRLLARAAFRRKTPAAEPPLDPKAFASGLYLALLRSHGAVVTGLAWSPDGAYLATAARDGWLRLYDLGAGARPGVVEVGSALGASRSRELPQGLTDVAWAAPLGAPPGSATVVVETAGASGSSGLKLVHFGLKGGDGAGDDAPVDGWQVEDVHGGAAALRLSGSLASSSGFPVLVSASEGPGVRIFTAAGRDLGTVQTGGLLTHGVEVSWDGRWIAAPSQASDVKIYEVMYDKAGKFSKIQKTTWLAGHRGSVRSLSFSPDGTRAVTSSTDGTLRRWDLNDVALRPDEAARPCGAVVGAALPLGEAYSALAWGPRGVIAAAHGGLLHFLDAESGEVLAREPAAHDGSPVAALAWAPVPIYVGGVKRHVLATAGRDGGTRLWTSPK